MIKKLEELIQDIETLKKLNQRTESSEFKTWKRKGEKLLKEKFGDNSKEYFQFSKKRYCPAVYGTGYNSELEYYQNRLSSVKTDLESYRIDFQEDIKATGNNPAKLNNKNVFIVHGHDNALKDRVCNLIHKVGYNPIVLHEQANLGKTIIEKIETFTDVCYGIVLYTPCDVFKKDQTEVKRARQNVVFEHGYLLSKLGRKNVAALHDKSVEQPSDISGLLYIEINNHLEFELAREMKNAGLEVDLNNL